MVRMTDPALRAAARHSPARRRGVRRDRAAGRLEDARRARRARRLALDRSLRAGRARAVRPADASAHLGRDACRPRPGYRLYVDELLARPEARPTGFELELPAARAEVEEALQATTEMLSQVTRLLALVSAPPLRGRDGAPRRGAARCSRDVVMVVRDHVDGRRHQPALRVPRAGRPGPRHVGGRLPERAPGRRAPRLARGQGRIRRAGPERARARRSCS